MWLAEAASRLEKGSSRRSISGSLWRTRASEVRWRIPCEYWPTGRFRPGVEADGAKGHLRIADAGAAAVAVQRGEVVEVLDCGELVVEHGRVAHVGHSAALIVRSFAEDSHRATRGLDEAGDDAEQRGFSGSVFPEDDGAGACVEAC